MKIISDGTYDDLMGLSDKLAFARAEAMAQTEQILLMQEQLEALKRTMSASANQLEFWYTGRASLEDMCLQVAAELRKAAS